MIPFRVVELERNSGIGIGPLVLRASLSVLLIRAGNPVNRSFCRASRTRNISRTPESRGGGSGDAGFMVRADNEGLWFGLWFRLDSVRSIGIWDGKMPFERVGTAQPLNSVHLQVIKRKRESDNEFFTYITLLLD